MALTMRQLVAARAAEMEDKKVEKKRKRMRRGLDPPPPPITLPPEGGTLVDTIERGAEIAGNDELWLALSIANFYVWGKIQYAASPPSPPAVLPWAWSCTACAASVCARTEPSRPTPSRNKNQRAPEKDRKAWMRRHGLTYDDVKKLLPADKFELHGPAHVTAPFALPSGKVMRKGTIGYVAALQGQKPPVVEFKYLNRDRDYVRERVAIEATHMEPVQSALAWGWRPEPPESDSEDD
eukprot:TRINITY_DN9798_c0_g1_i3.p1 TRINITY_DN9798_c0_g1~~TRINITY_DN9798_c0_g1_i3.p1  ORF type:complete len:238 (+),score=55.84 TRINITY_DN9798_c0_g1_i3:123-836(+)